MASCKARQLLFFTIYCLCAALVQCLLEIDQVPETNQCHYSRAIERTIRCLYGSVQAEPYTDKSESELENVVNTGNRYDDRNINLAYNDKINSRKSRAVVEPPPLDWRKQLTTRKFLEQDAGETVEYLIKLARDQVRNIKFRSAFRSALPSDLSDDQRRFFYILQNFKWEMRRLAERQRDNSTFWELACQADVQQTAIQCLRQEYFSCSALLDAQARGGVIQIWAATNTTTAVDDVGTAIDLAADYYCYLCNNASEFVASYYGADRAIVPRSLVPQEFRASYWSGKKGAQLLTNYLTRPSAASRTTVQLTCEEPLFELGSEPPGLNRSQCSIHMRAMRCYYETHTGSVTGTYVSGLYNLTLKRILTNSCRPAEPDSKCDALSELIGRSSAAATATPSRHKIVSASMGSFFYAFLTAFVSRMLA